jgi:hypothetical protein
VAIASESSVNGGMATSPKLPDLASLPLLDITALKAAWRIAFRSPAPKVARKEFFIRMLAFEIQRRTYGDLSKAALKTLRQFERRESTSQASPAAAELHAGARLIREWGGATHEVMVMERGYAYRGRSYASLSEIARCITGARWSGPRFFGLRVPTQRTKARATA